MDNVEEIETVETGDTGTETETETETPSEQEDERVSIGDALRRKFEVQKAVDEDTETEEEPAVEEEAATPTDTQVQPVTEERVPLVPPADMNKLEKEAFLNPTPQNAHVLQQYMNRRAYELRSDHQRRMVEIDAIQKQTSGVLDAIKQYEEDYARQGISLPDVAKRSIAWDRAMHNNPVQTAVEWLESYGLTVADLQNHANNPNPYAYQQPTPGYLTREEAERIAEEKMSAFQDEQQKKAVAYYNERCVESFVASKPLFKDPETASQLEAEMAPIVTALTNTGKYSSPEEILETAYNYVVAGNPTFSSLNNAMTAKAAIEQKQAAAQKAKAASRSISGSAGSGSPKIQTKDLRDNLRRRFSGE